MKLPNRYDLSADIFSALSSESDNRAVPGRTELGLEGLYRFETNGPIIEIELMETRSLRRSVVYTSATPSYLILPKGRYQAFYRPIEGPLHPSSQLLAVRLDPLAKIQIYLSKLVGLGLNPMRWASALRSRRVSRARAVGLSIAKKAIKPQKTLPPRAALARLPVPADTAVSIIIPTKIRHDLLSECLRSLKQIEGVTYEIIIVDNGATAPEMLTLLEAQALESTTRVIRYDIPFNFSTLCNLGAVTAQYPLLLFLNDDIEALEGNWLTSMCGFALREDVGVVGARLLYPSRDLQHGGIATHFLPGPGHPWRHLKEEEWRSHPLLDTAGEADAVTGACLLIRKTTFDQVGGFDEKRFAVTMNDVDLCLKTRRLGLKVVYDPGATLLHKEGQSRPDDEREDQQARHAAELRAFLQLYPDYARQSVFYPSNLRRDTERAAPIG
ncbi:glycosyltransferase family 2 protein [Asticcacaulis sp. AND118]|uniref:glycosyltransferase family 2 protein n=1 Tax=Asticcacaulis sp. AND118 TaxID=2840468 RepID=UPI001CFFCE56|nr:glycosyltransferase family 2 protein [Asticcacaulis sp. AND118]UDF03379.1 glycosyltransferase family 2 protein [Asticcacaulis sp. AND118]